MLILLGSIFSTKGEEDNSEEMGEGEGARRPRRWIAEGRLEVAQQK